jgi:serine protease Do
MLATERGGTVLKFSVSTLVAVVMALSLVLGCEMAGSRAEDSPQASPAVTAESTPPLPGAVEPSPFVAVAERVMPGVVSIDTKKTVSSTRSFGFDEPFGRLFQDLIPDLQERQYEVPSYASGFIFRRDGYVVTNNHVVADADEIVVRLPDETEYPAEVVGTDPNTDIAILRIDNGDLPIVPLGDSDAIRVGDWAIAIGNPFGRLEGSLTVGVISAKGRSALSIIGGSPALQDFIQTDASINFGNSGGPLVNIRGEAVGMNAAINPLGQGIGFAIPINLVKHVAEEIIEYGKVSWGYLGILPQEIDRDLADALNVEPKSGILVGSVVDDSPAADAGLRRRDIITELNGEHVTGDVDEFRLKVAQMGTGREVDVTVLRDGKRKDLKVKLGERPTEIAQAGERRERKDWLGLRVDDVTGTQGSRHAPQGVESGVVVVGVEEGSPAFEEGIRAGDLIEEINGEEVGNLDDYERLSGEARDKGDKPVLFLVRRDDINRYVAVKPSKE